MTDSSPRWAVLFDMDGVLIDSENEWHQSGAEFLATLFGDTLRPRHGETVGLSADDEYDLAISRGFTMDRQAFYDVYDRQALVTYSQAVMTPGLDDAIDTIAALGGAIGVVTAARRPWLETVLGRFRNRASVRYSLALGERRDLRSKPSPDGYITAMRAMNILPENTIVVEDSNAGIQAGRAAGAYVIGFSAHLLAGYQQVGADVYAATTADLLDQIRRYLTERLQKT